jgi:hypothetical protein
VEAKCPGHWRTGDNLRFCGRRRGPKGSADLNLRRTTWFCRLISSIGRSQEPRLRIGKVLCGVGVFRAHSTYAFRLQSSVDILIVRLTGV